MSMIDAVLLAVSTVSDALRKGRITPLAVQGFVKGAEQFGPIAEAYQRGDIDPADLAALAAKVKPVEYPVSDDQKRAADVMGKSFISPTAFCQALRGRVRFNEEDLEKLAAVPWTDEVLREELERGDAILFPGHETLTMGMLRGLFGADPEVQPCFYADNSWWLEAAGHPFRDQPLEVRWYLVRTKIEEGSTSKTWHDQGKLIPDTHRRHLALEVTLACLLIYRTQGGRRILEEMYAWCEDVDAGGYRVGVGYFGRNGLYVNADDPSDDWDGDFGLLLSRK